MDEFYGMCRTYKDMILLREPMPTWMVIFIWVTLPFAPIMVLSWFVSSLILLVLIGK